MINRKKLGNSNEASTILKFLCVFMSVFMLSTSLPLIAHPENVDIDDEILTEVRSFSFSDPTITQNDDEYISISVGGTTYDTMNSGLPILPKEVEVIEIPFNSVIKDVSFTHSDISTLSDVGITSPAPYPVYSKIGDAFVNSLINHASKIINKKSPEYIEYNSDQLRSLSKDVYESSEGYGDAFSYVDYVGINSDGERVTFVIATILPCVYSSVSNGDIEYFTDGELTVTYTLPESSSQTLDVTEGYDMLILSPQSYMLGLRSLVDHKESIGITTKLVSLNEIYRGDYFGKSDTYNRDEQEKIKYFIYNAINEWNITYVLLVGGYRTFLGLNIPDMQFPVRYSKNFEFDMESGDMYTTDQYYSCCIKSGGEFDSWDTSDNGIFGEWNFEGYDTYDPMPDVFIGRLACRNNIELNTVVNKIITYENTVYGKEWLNDFLVVTGDAFGDCENLAVDWDTSGIASGQYTIYAQSKIDNIYSPNNGLLGPIDSVVVTVDKLSDTRLTYTEDDHLKIEPLVEGQNISGKNTTYPGKPVAEIVVPSDDDVVGKNCLIESAACYDSVGSGYADTYYKDEILKIKTKSYDPSTQEKGDRSSHTTITVWVEDWNNNTVFGPVIKSSNLWYEGETIAQSAVDVMTGFNTTELFTSNGRFSELNDVIEEMSIGHGFVYFDGHSCPNSWGDHVPGIPGGRKEATVSGLASVNLAGGNLERYKAKPGDSVFPIDHITNGDELPIVLLSGCHSGQFDTSLMTLLTNPYDVLIGERYGSWTPEGMSWWLVRSSKGGSIATIANTGLGYGGPGEYCTTSYVGWLYPRFFINYQSGVDILGAIFTSMLEDWVAYTGTCVDNKGDRKMLEELVLLGDPSLKIGGYNVSSNSSLSISEDNLEPQLVKKMNKDDVVYHIDPTPLNNDDSGSKSLSTGDYHVTYLPNANIEPVDLVYSSQNGKDKFITGYTHETTTGKNQPGFSFSNGGAVWNSIIWTSAYDAGHTAIDTWGENESEIVASAPFDSLSFGKIDMTDVTDPFTWEVSQWGLVGDPFTDIGKCGVYVTGYTIEGDECQQASNDFCGLWSIKDGSRYQYMLLTGDSIWSTQGTTWKQSESIIGDSDDTTGYHFYVVDLLSSSQGHIIYTNPSMENMMYHTQASLDNPDIAANNGHVYIVSESGANIMFRHSTNNASTFSSTIIVSSASGPNVVINDDDSVDCYYVVSSGNIYKITSNDYGSTWSSPILIDGIDDVDYESERPFVVSNEGIVYQKDDGQLYINIDIDTIGVHIDEIILSDDHKSISTEIKNSGTMTLDNVTWEISIDSDSPIGKWLGDSIIMNLLFRGRILKHGYVNDTIPVMETAVPYCIDNEYHPVFGIGHVDVCVSVIYNDEIIGELHEDGFIFGEKLYIFEEDR